MAQLDTRANAPADHESGGRRASGPKRVFSAFDVAHALNAAAACLLSYWVMVTALSRFVDRSNDLLGGMWAVIATIFVFRETSERTLSAGLDRLAATCVSFALCLPYLCFLPFNPLGLSLLIFAGAVVMALLGRRDDIALTGIATTVVMVVAAIDPNEAWRQPFLRLIDTVVGITVGVTFKSLGSLRYYGAASKIG